MISDNDRLNLLLDLRRYADAEKAARDAIGRNPDWASGYTHLARALMGLNKKDEAIDAAREGARKAPLDAWAVGTLACALNWFGKYKEALEPAEQAVRIDARYAWAYSMLANILYNLDRFKDARARALEGLRFDPLNESLIRWKGWAEHKLGDQAEAIRTAEEGLKHHPNSHLLLNLIGCVKWTQAEKLWWLLRLRLHREADAMLRDSIRLDPTQPAYRDNLRGNVLSCRNHLFGNVLPAAHVAFTVVPVCVLAATVVRYASLQLAVIAAFLTLTTFGVTCLVGGNERFVLAAPLDRFGVPTVPVTRRDHRLGWLGLRVCCLLMVVPYCVLLFALFK